MEAKQHWEHIYTSKKSEEYSWTQDARATSISFLTGFSIPKTAPIIDIGGGDSKLVDFLLAEGYTDIHRAGHLRESPGACKDKAG